MTSKSRKHKDTSVSLQPLTFGEAIAALAQAPKHEDSGAKQSGNTRARAPESAPSKKRAAPRRKPSAG
jgi:hypothetical protein